VVTKAIAINLAFYIVLISQKIISLVKLVPYSVQNSKIKIKIKMAIGAEPPVRGRNVQDSDFDFILVHLNK
jgi:predicted methyltransferase